MERTFLLGALVLTSLSLVTAGRFRYPVKPGSGLDRFFVRLQIAYNVWDRFEIPAGHVAPAAIIGNSSEGAWRRVAWSA
jgi:hypothetical protein